MGRKKINKANDAFQLKKAREQSNKKNDTKFGNHSNTPPNIAALNTFLAQVKAKSIQQKQAIDDVTPIS